MRSGWPPGASSMRGFSQYLDPDLIQQVRRLDLRARFIVEGFLAGLHGSPFHGLSVEFSEHRKYAHGDDLRTIDWNVFARTDRLFVRKYVAETNLACHLLIDASASMGYVGPRDARDPRERPAKLLYAIHLAAALGYLVTHQQDAIGLAILGDGLERMLPPRSRRQDLAQLLATLAAVRPAGPTRLAEGIAETLSRIAHRGLLVLMSDLLTEPDQTLAALHHIRHRGHDLIVMHILDAAETSFEFDGPLRLEDPESGRTLAVDAAGVRETYRFAVQRWREELRRQISGLRGDYVALDTATPFDKALIEFLVQRRRRR